MKAPCSGTSNFKMLLSSVLLLSVDSATARETMRYEQMSAGAKGVGFISRGSWTAFIKKQLQSLTEQPLSTVCSPKLL